MSLNTSKLPSLIFMKVKHNPFKDIKSPYHQYKLKIEDEVFNITNKQGLLILTTFCHPCATRTHIEDALWPVIETAPLNTRGNISILMCKINKKIKHTGWRFSSGYNGCHRFVLMADEPNRYRPHAKTWRRKV